MQQLGGNQGVQGVPSICTIQLKIFSEKFQACKEGIKAKGFVLKLGSFASVAGPQRGCRGFQAGVLGQTSLEPLYGLLCGSESYCSPRGRGVSSQNYQVGVFYIELSSKNCSTQIPLTTQKLFQIDTTHYLKNCSIQKPHTSQEHSSYNYIFIYSIYRVQQVVFKRAVVKIFVQAPKVRIVKSFGTLHVDKEWCYMLYYTCNFSRRTTYALRT